MRQAQLILHGWLLTSLSAASILWKKLVHAQNLFYSFKEALSCLAFLRLESFDRVSFHAQKPFLDVWEPFFRHPFMFRSFAVLIFRHSFMFEVRSFVKLCCLFMLETLLKQKQPGSQDSGSLSSGSQPRLRMPTCSAISTEEMTLKDLSSQQTELTGLYLHRAPYMSVVHNCPFVANDLWNRKQCFPWQRKDMMVATAIVVLCKSVTMSLIA